jgi:protein ImuB
MSFLSLFVPNFHLQAALRAHGLGVAGDCPNKWNDRVPAALIEEHDRKPVILQLNRAAESAGVAARMTPSQALARCLDLLILGRSPQQEIHLQEILLEQAFTLSPYVEASAPGLCTVQFFDQRNRTEAILRGLNELQACQIEARAGAGPTPDVSYLAAHCAQPFLLVDDSKEFLGPLPLEVLLCDVAGVRPA